MPSVRVTMLAAAGLLVSSGCSSQSDAQISPPLDPVKVLETSRDRDALQAAAIALASSGNPQSVDRLGDFFGRAEFLARLDDLSTLPDKTRRLQRVFAALAEHPSDASARVCLALATSPAFLSEDTRRIYLLPALAAVRPMSDAAARVLRNANADGYYNLNLVLLAKNASPNALKLFEEMIRDSNVLADQRMDGAHLSILPVRTDPAILDSVTRLLSSSLEPNVAVALIESIFDDQTARWFPPSASRPVPPPWEDAPKPALQKVIALANQVRSRNLPPELSAAVKRTTERVRNILKP